MQVGSNTNRDKQDKQLPHPHTCGNCPTRIIQRIPIRQPNTPIPTATSTNNWHVTTHTRTRMAHPCFQDFEKQPHPASHKVQEKARKWTGLEGGEIRTVELAYKGPWVIEPHMDGPISHPA